MNAQYKINKADSKKRRAARQLAEAKVEMDKREYLKNKEMKDKQL